MKGFEWFYNNIETILIGLLSSILASIIVLFSQSFVSVIIYLLTKRFILFKIWCFKNPQTIIVVSGDINKSQPDITTAILSGLDAEAAHRLIATAHLLYPKTNIEHVYSSSSILFSPEYYKENLIIVGGPINNTCSFDFLNRYKSIVEFLDNDEEDYYLIKFHDKLYTPTNNTDFGIILRDINPMNNLNKHKNIILIAGCDSFGGLAASKIIDYYRDDTLVTQKKLFFKIYRNIFKKKNYIALISCEKLGNTVTNISLVDFHIITNDKRR